MTFNHFNFNVFDLEKSLDFYQKAFDLSITDKGCEAEDGSFKIVFLSDNKTGFGLELTWLRDRKEPYNLGDLEYHLAFMADDYDAVHKRHEEMGIICFENPAMGIYFVADPDGYWIEVVPAE